MSKCILLIIVFLVNFSAKQNGIAENADSNNAIAVRQSGPDPIESKNVVVKIGFPLDSLLGFDSEEALRNVFGQNIKRSVGYNPEGLGEYPNTLLYPGTVDQVEFVWQDDSITFSGLVYIKVSGQVTNWKTKEGITLGTTLKELEKLNHKPFTFYGFGWDYPGMVEWDNGRLQDRKVFVSLEYPGEAVPPEYEGLLGDHGMRSDSGLAQKANPVVYEIIMGK